MEKLLVTVEDAPVPDVVFCPIKPPAKPPVDVTLAFEKLFKMLLGLALLLEALLPMSPPRYDVPDIEPVEKLLLMGPELVPTNPPSVPARE